MNMLCRRKAISTCVSLAYTHTVSANATHKLSLTLLPERRPITMTCVTALTSFMLSTHKRMYANAAFNITLRHGSLDAIRVFLQYVPVYPWLTSIACAANRPDALKLLLETGMKVSDDDFYNAVMNNNLPLVTVILESGEPVTDFILYISDVSPEMSALVLKYT